MKRLLAAIFAVALLAGCGGTKTVTRTVVRSPQPAPAFTVAGGHCLDKQDTATICQLRTLPAPFSFTSPLGAPQLRGLDSWGPPPLSVLDGSYQYGNAYLSTDSSKNWSAGSVAAYRKAGKGVVMTWETYATRAAAGRAAGVADAQEASRQAAADGAPGAPIDFAVDFQAGCSQITAYFQGVHSVLGARAGVYGGYDQVWCVYRQGLVGHQNWQTYAWSSGRWLPANIAPQEQWLNGSTYDQDRALTSSYGQAFQNTPPPPPPDRYARMDHVRRHFHVRAYGPAWGAPHTVIASEHNTMTTWHNHACRNPVRRPTCKASHYHLELLRGRLWTVAQRKHPHWANGRGVRFQIMSRALASK